MISSAEVQRPLFLLRILFLSKSWNQVMPSMRRGLYDIETGPQFGCYTRAFLCCGFIAIVSIG